MIVSSQLFEAYIECATKCWLRSRAEPSRGNVYAEWARAQNEAYRQDALKSLSAGSRRRPRDRAAHFQEFQGCDLAHCYRRAVADERT